MRGTNVSMEGSDTNRDEEMQLKFGTHRLPGYDHDLPIGYNFAPTDEELVKGYLVPKIRREPQPARFVHDADAQDIYHSSPSEHLLDIQGVLGAQGQKSLYFFIRENHHLGSKRVVDDENGCWKTIATKRLIDESDRKLYAHKRKLVFFNAATLETGWHMNEYRLSDNFLKDSQIKGDQYVLARIRYRPQASIPTFTTPVSQINSDQPQEGSQLREHENQIGEIDSASKGSCTGTKQATYQE